MILDELWENHKKIQISIGNQEESPLKPDIEALIDQLIPEKRIKE
jgi:hypothetical protein